MEELMRVFEVNNGRPPTAEDIGKWIATIREAGTAADGFACAEATLWAKRGVKVPVAGPLM